MTNREMLMVLKNATSSFIHIKEVAEKIISNTCDSNIEYVNYVKVKENDVIVNYGYSCRGEYSDCEVIFPIEWFDEGFDYILAYKEQQRKLKEKQEKIKAKRKKHKAKKRKQAKKLKEKKEYNTYLKLKEKYESKE